MTPADLAWRLRGRVMFDDCRIQPPEAEQLSNLSGGTLH